MRMATDLRWGDWSPAAAVSTCLKTTWKGLEDGGMEGSFVQNPALFHRVFF